MTIKGLDEAIRIALNRVERIKEPILIVQIDDNEYVLWRERTQETISTHYTHYRIIKRVIYNDIRS